MLYAKPWIEILKFEVEDVICSSSVVEGGFHNPQGPEDDNVTDLGGTDW